MSFDVQMHMHTSETSPCGEARGADMARACAEAGYGTIFITDHFFNANIGCPKDAPWAEKVEYLGRGYRAAKAEGEKLGLYVNYAWETFNDGREFLTYGLGDDFLLANPGIDLLSPEEYVRVVKAAGALVVQAHPFRRASYIPLYEPDPHLADAYETYNADNEDLWNRLAGDMAWKHGLIQTAGSDAHSTQDVVRGAMRFSRPVRDARDLAEALFAGDGKIVERLDAPSRA